MAASWLESYYLDDEFLSFSLESRSMPWESLVNCQTLGYTRRRSEGKRWREKYVLIGLISGVIAKSVMHVHITIFWTIVLGIIGSIIGGAVPLPTCFR